MSRLAFVICMAWVVIVTWVIVAMYFSYRMQLPQVEVESFDTRLAAGELRKPSDIAWLPNSVCFIAKTPKPVSDA